MGFCGDHWLLSFGKPFPHDGYFGFLKQQKKAPRFEEQVGSPVKSTFCKKTEKDDETDRFQMNYINNLL